MALFHSQQYVCEGRLGAQIFHSIIFHATFIPSFLSPVPEWKSLPWPKVFVEEDWVLSFCQAWICWGGGPDDLADLGRILEFILEKKIVIVKSVIPLQQDFHSIALCQNGLSCFSLSKDFAKERGDWVLCSCQARIFWEELDDPGALMQILEFIPAIKGCHIMCTLATRFSKPCIKLMTLFFSRSKVFVPEGWVLGSYMITTSITLSKSFHSPAPEWMVSPEP